MTVNKPDVVSWRWAFAERQEFYPKAEASYPLSSDLSGLWQMISNCSRDLLKCRGCSGLWGCLWVGSPEPPPCKTDTRTTAWASIRRRYYIKEKLKNLAAHWEARYRAELGHRGSCCFQRKKFKSCDKRFHSIHPLRLFKKTKKCFLKH